MRLNRAMNQHKVVEEQLHCVATTWTTMLKEPLQRAALDISGAGAEAVKSLVQNSQHKI
jgi:hypothetical protein